MSNPLIDEAEALKVAAELQLKYSRSAQSNWITEYQNRTENELASRFINENERKLRYCVEWQKWLVWTGKRWQMDMGEVVLMARGFSNRLWESLGGCHGLEKEEYGVIRTFCKSYNRDAGIHAYLNLAKVDERISVRVSQLNQWGHLLNLQNGSFNLTSGEVEPHDQEYLLTQIANVEFRESATCDRWTSAIELIFGGDADLIRYVRQLLGYSLSADTGEHILPIAFGSGCNGKSFVWNVVLSLMGEFAGLANDSLLMGMKDNHPTEKAFLYQKRFVPISEPEQSSRLRESRVKELTGDGTITARRMHEDFWSFQRTHTFWLSTNHLPRITGNDDGIWRRVKLIPFLVDLRKVITIIPDLDKILVETEGPGILNWLLAGWIDYRRHGFIEPECVKAATGDYRNQEDELAMFIADNCTLEKDDVSVFSEIYGRYSGWGGKHSKVVFGKEMKSRFDWDAPTSGPYKSKTVFFGIGLENK